MRLILTTVVLLVALYPSSGLTQDVCGPQDYDAELAPDFDCPGPGEEAMLPRLQPPPSVPVHQGETVVAEWDGVLMHRDRLVLTGLKITGLRRLRWADRLQLAERYYIGIEYARSTSETREELLEEQADYHQDRADAATQAAERALSRSNAWYRSWWFGFISGTLVSAALVALAAYVVTVI